MSLDASWPFGLSYRSQMRPSGHDVNRLANQKGSSIIKRFLCLFIGQIDHFKKHNCALSPPASHCLPFKVTAPPPGLRPAAASALTVLPLMMRVSGRLALRAYLLRARALSAVSTPSLFLDSGSSRTRLPVAAKMALQSAGTNGGTPGSPTPPGGALLSTIVTFV